MPFPETKPLSPLHLPVSTVFPPLPAPSAISKAQIFFQGHEGGQQEDSLLFECIQSATPSPAMGIQVQHLRDGGHGEIDFTSVAQGQRVNYINNLWGNCPTCIPIPTSHLGTLEQ